MNRVLWQSIASLSRDGKSFKQLNKYSLLTGVIALAASVATCADETPSSDLATIFKQRAEAIGSPFRQSALDTYTQTSEVLPGVTYHWGLYRPHIEDAHWVEIIAFWNNETVRLSQPDDWLVLARTTTPKLNNAAVEVCGEIVRVTGPMRHPVAQSRIYRGLETIQQLAVPEGMSVGKLTPPTTVRDQSGAGWTTRLWILEPGRSSLYQCRIDPWTSVTLTREDSIVGFGLTPIHP